MPVYSSLIRIMSGPSARPDLEGEYFKITCLTISLFYVLTELGNLPLPLIDA